MFFWCLVREREWTGLGGSKFIAEQAEGAARCQVLWWT